MKLLHKILFWSHLIAGVIAGTVIFLMSATGVLLMYEHQIVEYAERDGREITAPGGTARRLDWMIWSPECARRIATPDPRGWYCATNRPRLLPSASAVTVQPT
jgi:hypothetical protein